MINNIEELKKILEGKYPDDAIYSFLEVVKPFFDFNDYMKIKKGLSTEELEKEFQEYISNEIIKLNIDISDSPIKDFIEKLSEITETYAKINEYENYLGISKSMKRILEISLTGIISNESF